MSVVPIKQNVKRALALGTATVAAGAGSAQAAIVYFDLVDVTVSDTPEGGIYVDVDNGTVTTTSTGNEDLTFGLANFDFGRGVKPLVLGSVKNGSLFTGGYTVTKFAGGATINSASERLGFFYSGATPSLLSFGEWSPDTGPGYAGFSIDLGGGPLYGWAQLDYFTNPDLTRSLTLKDFAYEDSGAPIITPVPEPSTAGLVVAALAGSAALYRRRSNRALV